MPLLDKQRALAECRERFEEVIIEHLAENTEYENTEHENTEDEDETRELYGQLIEELNESLLVIVDEIFSRANPY